jgi:hypothetical protein
MATESDITFLPFFFPLVSTSFPFLSFSFLFLLILLLRFLFLRILLAVRGVLRYVLGRYGASAESEISIDNEVFEKGVDQEVLWRDSFFLTILVVLSPNFKD